MRWKCRAGPGLRPRHANHTAENHIGAGLRSLPLQRPSLKEQVILEFLTRIGRRASTLKGPDALVAVGAGAPLHSCVLAAWAGIFALGAFLRGWTTMRQTG